MAQTHDATAGCHMRVSSPRNVSQGRTLNVNTINLKEKKSKTIHILFPHKEKKQSRSVAWKRKVNNAAYTAVQVRHSNQMEGR